MVFEQKSVVLVDFINNIDYEGLSGLAGALGVPYTRNRQYAGATATGGSVELWKPIERQ